MIEADHGRFAELLDVLDMLVEVFQSFHQRFGVGFLNVFPVHPAVHLQGPAGGHQNHRGGVEVGAFAFNVEKFFRSQVEAETRFGHRPIGEGQGHAGGQDRVASVRDVGERPPVHEGGDAFQGLHQIRQQGFFQ